MDTTSSSALLTATLITVRACVRDINAAILTEEQIALLHEIANFAIANAQEARWVRDEHEASLSQVLEHERALQAKLVAESDAADHQIAHLV